MLYRNLSMRNKELWQLLYPRIIFGSVFAFAVFFLVSAPKITQSIVENQHALSELHRSFYRLQALYSASPEVQASGKVEGAQKDLLAELSTFQNRPFIASMSRVDDSFLILLGNAEREIKAYIDCNPNGAGRSTEISACAASIESLMRELHDLLAVYADRQIFTIRMQNLFLIVVIGFCVAAVIFLDIKKRFEEINKEHIRALSRRYLTDLENSHARIALDIHDTVLQELAVARQYNYEMREGAVSDEQRRRNNALDSSLDTSMKVLRNIIDETKPWDTTAISLNTSIRSVIHRFFKDDSVELRLMIAELPEMKLSVGEKNQILSILKEALWNVRKHAEATLVDVAAKWKEPWILISVIDNGRGFAVRRGLVQSSKHVGLFSMRERAAMIGGSVTIDSKPGEGTKVVLRVKKE
jgi:signal transduction histidine kinase